MRVLVTGGAGNLGQEIVHTLLGDGHDAVIFDQVEAKKPDGAISLTGSILDRDDVAVSLRAYRIEAIIHLASMLQFVCDREAMTRCAAISPTFLAAYNFAKRLKTLKGLTPHEYVCKIWSENPGRFNRDPVHHTPGLYT